MERSSNETSQEMASSTPAVPMASQSSATQIFLIKEELPNNQINSNLGVPSSYQIQRDQYIVLLPLLRPQVSRHQDLQN